MSEPCFRLMKGYQLRIEAGLQNVHTQIDTHTLSEWLSMQLIHLYIHDPYRPLEPTEPKYPAPCKGSCEGSVAPESMFKRTYSGKSCRKTHDGVAEAYCEDLKEYPLVHLDGGLDSHGQPQPCTNLPCIFEVMTGVCKSPDCKSRHYLREQEWKKIRSWEAEALEQSERRELERREAEALAEE